MAKQPIKKIGGIIEEFDNSHQNPINRAVQIICIPLLTFGFLGMIWSVPFPHLAFLGSYNGFVNWASFLIAFSIYYYYKVSPVLSYGILLIIFAFSAGIVSLEKLHNTDNWPTMGMVCLLLFVVGLILQFIGYKNEGKFPSASQQIKSLLTAPLWLMYTVFNQLGVKLR